MKWIQFVDIKKFNGVPDPDGGFVDAMGSDGVLPVDGRLSVNNIRAIAENKAWSLRRIKRFDGFVICTGERYSRPSSKSEYFPLPKNFG